MNTTDRILLVAVVAALFAVTAQAQTTMKPQGSTASPPQQLQQGFTGELRSGAWGDESFARLDADKDGMLSRAEAQADPILREAWPKLDTQNVGRVTRDEFSKYGASQAASKTAPNFNSAGPVPAPKSTTAK